jgi:hypothetical protein
VSATEPFAKMLTMDALICFQSIAKKSDLGMVTIPSMFMLVHGPLLEEGKGTPQYVRQIAFI